MNDLSEKYPHLAFDWNWTHLLTQINREFCVAIESELNAIKELPLDPAIRSKIYRISLEKGAHATVAIEGNTLTSEQVSWIAEGKSLDKPSLKYSELEVSNVLFAFNCYSQNCNDDSFGLIDQDLLTEMHRMIGKDLGEDFGAIPGKFRENNVIVGQYRAPDYVDLPQLLTKFETWLKEQFSYSSGNQTFCTGLFQAICAHVFFELTHPFGDGNGRVGRLLEFYLLLRTFVPLSCATLLTNHYNNTRTRYFRLLTEISRTKNQQETIHAFIKFTEYALEGFLDGLRENFKTINAGLWHTTWKQYVYGYFETQRGKYTKKDVFQRRLHLALLLPLNMDFSIHRIRSLGEELSTLYQSVSQRTLERDIKELLDLKLIRLTDAGKNLYCMNVNILNEFAQTGRIRNTL